MHPEIESLGQFMDEVYTMLCQTPVVDDRISLIGSAYIRIHHVIELGLIGKEHALRFTRAMRQQVQDYHNEVCRNHHPRRPWFENAAHQLLSSIRQLSPNASCDHHCDREGCDLMKWLDLPAVPSVEYQ